MDKVLKYKFWILSGLVLPLALAGFFIATGGMQAATEERIAQLKGINPPNPMQPNDTFTVVARKQADLQERANAEQLNRLDKIQRAWMTWPKAIEVGLERKPDTKEIVYRADTLKVDYRIKYPDEYERQMQGLWLKFNPVIPSGLPFTSRNLVFVDRTVVPTHPFIPGRTPTTQQIWDAQEDFWILSMLAEAINKTNAVAQYNVTDSAIREIFYLELFGGTGESTVTSAPDMSGGGAEPGYMTGAEGSGAPGAALTIAFADGAAGFDPQEEYGSQAGGADAAAEAVEGGLFGGGGAAVKPLRYIGFDESNPGPYRKRGFYISLLILERKIPDFVTNLANLDPPVLAGRWGFANNPYDTDHLLRAALRPGAGGGGALDPTGGGFPGGAPRGPRRPQRPGAGGYGGDYAEGPAAGVPMPLNPRDPLANLTPKMRAEVDALRSALLAKDLVQLDLAGVVTIFTPDVPPPIVEEPEPEAAPPPAPTPAVETPAAPTPTETPEPTDPAATDPAPATEQPEAPTTPAPATEPDPAAEAPATPPTPAPGATPP